jgi:RNA polymerase sigma-70 factor (ECF subfamily)
VDDPSDLATRSGLSAEWFADAVFNRYADRLLRVAGRRLGARLRAKVSPEDIVQSAFKSLYRRRHAFRFQDDVSDGLWGLLVVITIRKCAKWADLFGAEKRAVDREVPLDGAASEGRPGIELAGREPGPAEAAELAELTERLMGGLDARRRRIVSLRLEGHELEEIAALAQSSRRTVVRVIAEAKAWLRAELDAAACAAGRRVTGAS